MQDSRCDVCEVEGDWRLKIEVSEKAKNGNEATKRKADYQGQKAHRPAGRLCPHDAVGHQHRAAQFAGAGQSLIVCVF